MISSEINLTIVPGASGDEVAAVVAALEQFQRQSLIGVPDQRPASSRWKQTAIREGATQWPCLTSEVPSVIRPDGYPHSRKADLTWRRHMPDDPVVLTENQEGVLVITINRQDARNSINQAVAAGIADALETLDHDPSLSVGVLTGAGGYFCAGMDLKAFAAGDLPWVDDRGFAGITERSADKPLIAAIEGFAVAGGLEIALSCDLIVASEGAKLGLPEVKRSLIAAGGGLLRLPRLIPRNIAYELAFTGDPISAERAYELGLVNRLATPGLALAAALKLAAAIATNGPLAVQGSKRILKQSADWSDAEFFERQREIWEPVFASEDAREGATAFAEKRAPVWRGV